jgi:hypothetical protein
MPESYIYAPIKEFPSIAQRLVLVEALLNNMTSAELDTLSTFVSSHTNIQVSL